MFGQTFLTNPAIPFAIGEETHNGEEHGRHFNKRRSQNAVDTYFDVNRASVHPKHGPSDTSDNTPVTIIQEKRFVESQSLITSSFSHTTIETLMKNVDNCRFGFGLADSHPISQARCITRHLETSL